MVEEIFGRKLENILADAQYIDTRINITKIAVDLLKPNPYQARIDYPEDEIEQLAQSIKNNGLLEPILVRKKGDFYEIIAGHRRFMAVKKLGLKEIEVKILNISDAKLCEVSLVENLERKDLNPLERANGYKKLIDIFGYTQEQVAKIFNISPSAVSYSLKLLTLPPAIKEYLTRGNLSEGHAKLLLSITDISQQLSLAQRVINENLSVRDLEELLATIKPERKSKIQRQKSSIPLELQQFQVKLSTKFNTKAIIKLNNKTNTGSIILKFFNSKHFNEIIDQLLK